MNVVYLDYAASAPLCAPARDAMMAAADLVGNPSSVHRDGRAARAVLENAREQVASLCRARPGNVVFTASATEANNLALTGLDGSAIAASAVEHPSVLRAAPGIVELPVDGEGVLCLDALDTWLRQSGGEKPLVSIMLANNETGVIQPIAAAAEICRRHGALLHCDAVQAAGKLALDIAALGVDVLSLSAHKIGGPKGAGALVLARDMPLRACLRGGGQERGRRAGTEALPAIAGFGAAAAAVDLDSMDFLGRERARFEAELQRAVPGVVVAGAKAPRLATISLVMLPGTAAETQLMALDLDGIAASSGSACSSGKIQTSHVLAAMKVEPSLAASAIRVSIGPGTTARDIDRILVSLAAQHSRSRARDHRAA